MADATQHNINLQAQFGGGTSTIAQVATLGDRMLAANASAVEFERAIKATTAALDESTNSVKASSDAVSVAQRRGIVGRSRGQSRRTTVGGG
jgi:hypothetical protein